MPRAPKKSETLEVRLDHPAKQAFMARCRAEGRTASDAVRAFIEAELAQQPRRLRRGGLRGRLLAGALLAAAAGAVAAPTLAHTARAESRMIEFKRLDANHDGVISKAEFLRGR